MDDPDDLIGLLDRLRAVRGRHPTSSTVMMACALWASRHTRLTQREVARAWGVSQSLVAHRTVEARALLAGRRSPYLVGKPTTRAGRRAVRRADQPP